MFESIYKFIKDEYQHYMINKLEQMKFEAEDEIKKLQELDDGKNERIKIMLEMKQGDLESIRIKLSLRKRKHDGLES